MMSVLEEHNEYEVGNFFMKQMKWCVCVQNFCKEKMYPLQTLRGDNDCKLIKKPIVAPKARICNYVGKGNVVVSLCDTSLFNVKKVCSYPLINLSYELRPSNHCTPFIHICFPL